MPLKVYSPTSMLTLLHLQHMVRHASKANHPTLLPFNIRSLVPHFQPVLSCISDLIQVGRWRQHAGRLIKLTVTRLKYFNWGRCYRVVHQEELAALTSFCNFGHKSEGILIVQHGRILGSWTRLLPLTRCNRGHWKGVGIKAWLRRASASHFDGNMQLHWRKTIPAEFDQRHCVVQYYTL